MGDRPRAVVLDAIGTLFDPAPVGECLLALGAPPEALRSWMHRTLHAAAALTLIGDFRPFAEIASASAATLLAQLELDPGGADGVVAALAGMPPQPDAAEALERLAAAGVAAAVLTNGGGATTRRILERAGLLRHVAAVVSVEEAGAYKPDGRAYRHMLERLAVAPGEATLIAAHGWDCAGARAAGMGTVWVDRMERRWPMPPPQPPTAPGLVGAVALALVPA